MSISVILGIMIYLLNHEKTNAQTLSEKFEISTRSVYRYVDYLSFCGIPIATICGRNGGIYIDKQFKIKNLFFTKDEIEKLLSLTKDDTILNEKINYLKMNNYS